eukprot:scaffold518_cov388-Prasinococcus_capsulatus_cf.AAC.73
MQCLRCKVPAGLGVPLEMAFLVSDTDELDTESEALRAKRKRALGWLMDIDPKTGDAPREDYTCVFLRRSDGLPFTIQDWARLHYYIYDMYTFFNIRRKNPSVKVGDQAPTSWDSILTSKSNDPASPILQAQYPPSVTLGYMQIRYQKHGDVDALFRRYSNVQDLEHIDRLIAHEEKVKKFKKLFVKNFPFGSYACVKQDLLDRFEALKSENVAESSDDLENTQSIWIREYTPDLHEAARIVYNNAALSEQVCVAVGMNVHAFTDPVKPAGSFPRMQAVYYALTLASPVGKSSTWLEFPTILKEQFDEEEIDKVSMQEVAVMFQRVDMFWDGIGDWVA